MSPTYLYTHRFAGRSWMNFLALGVCALMLTVAFHYSAPWYFLAPVGLATAMALWGIIANPQSGSDLTSENLSFFHWGKTETIAIADIASMKVSRWSEGPDTVALNLNSGGVVHVPSVCADSKLAIALQDLGVREVGGDLS
jgi:hypothetical protein